jgi:fibronectin type III domain protein
MSRRLVASLSVFVAGLLIVVAAGTAFGSAQPTRADSVRGVHLASAIKGQGKPAAESLSAWRKMAAKRRPSGAACFTVSYPDLTWRRFRCQAPPRNFPPYPAVAQNHPPENVGGGTDFATVATGTSSAQGSFPSLTSSSSPPPTETENCEGAADCTENGSANVYSLQLNTNHFLDPGLCSTLPNPATECYGWQQFIYSARANAIFMQYWLNDSGLTKSSTCPANYLLYLNPPGKNTWSGCYANSNSGYLSTVDLSVPPVAALNNSNVTLTGYAVAGGNDTVVMAVAGTMIEVQEPDLAPSGQIGGPGLAGNWTQSEFGIFGDCCASQAVFNSGTSLDSLTSVVNTQTSPPTCTLAGNGLTAETNNLNFANAPAATGASAPHTGYLLSNQLTPAPDEPSCARATTWGETHLVTLANDPGATSDLKYDFQSTGDYTLANAPNFTVETQQVADPANTQLAVNRQIGANIGGADVAICSGSSPTRLFVNGNAVNLSVGGQFKLPDGIISLNNSNIFAANGTAYLVQDDSGNYVQAGAVPGNGLVPFWLDAQVGTGSWPTTVSGLLANAGNNVNEIQSSNGATLTVPFDFTQFYQEYAPSWVVSPSTSLTAPCGSSVSVTNPTTNVTAYNLNPSQYGLGLSNCQAAGVAGPLLNACILDVATLGTLNTASIYASVPTDLTWGEINQGTAPTSPGTPTHVSASPGSGEATVTFEPPATDGGSPITDYTVTATDLSRPWNGGQQASGTSTVITVPGLTHGDTYTFTVTATNEVGTSSASSSSNTVTP